jgi:hypothetical protein
MSAIRGEGTGSTHTWAHVWTAQVGSNAPLKRSVYKCEKCGRTFTHWYDLVPDIFDAMNREGVEDPCPGAGPGAAVGPT